MEFKKWPSIPRLSKEMVTVTEKLDGSNSCIRIRKAVDVGPGATDWCRYKEVDGEYYFVWTQSRSRFLKPNKQEDNFGFATWVAENVEELIRFLGVGDHYGEWWGSKIQRGYGLTNGDRRFSLFDAHKWKDSLHYSEPTLYVLPNLYVVPMLYHGSLYDLDVNTLAESLRETGSLAAPGFSAEGMVVYLRELRASYKVLLENDDIHKWELANV